jgi:hypothetical protein
MKSDTSIKPVLPDAQASPDVGQDAAAHVVIKQSVAYSVCSLAEIAAWFDVRSTEALLEAEGALTNKNRMKYCAISATWSEAARILRHTAIVGAAASSQTSDALSTTEAQAK